jgi:microcin C transport system substrate-binding protein
MQGYAFNIRRELFRDPRVRQALGYLFDFEWTNKTLFYGAYTRSKSYWNNSELGSSGLPTGPELALLEQYRGRIPEQVFTTPYEPPVSDGSGNIRNGLREALRLLQAAGWSTKGKQLTNDKTGAPFEFEILVDNPSFERITLPFVQNLERAGIAAHLRTVDTSQYINRTENFDFDMIVGSWGESPSPGNEQREFWTSAAADRPGSSNIVGVKDPVVDELVERLINVPDYEQLTTVTHALDRVLLNGYFVIPHWYLGSFRVTYWNKLQRPAVTPKYNIGFEAWWAIPGKEEELETEKAKLKQSQ